MNVSKIANGLLIAVTLLSVGCGKKEEPPPPAPAPTQGAPANGGFSGNLEDPSPGTQLSQSNYQAAYQNLTRNLVAGTATTSGQTLIDYTVQPGYRDAIFTRQAGTPNQPQTPTNSTFLFRGVSQGYLEDFAFSLVFYTNYGDAVQFNLALEYSLYGKMLYTTDQMAIFVARGGGRQILKVMYASASPAMVLYSIEEYGGGYNGSQIRLNVLQKNLTTQIQQGASPR